MKLYKRGEPVWVDVEYFVVFYDTCDFTWMFTSYIEFLSIFREDLFTKS